MANRAHIVKFKTVSSWSAGPKKPTETIAEGSESAIKTAVASALDDLSEMSTGDSICITVIVE